jgi:MFS family permease
VTAALRRTFSSLAVRNYRLYFTGQTVSIAGNWMQIVAEMWLMVKLTGSGAAVGITAGLQFLPMLLFGAWGGLLADRIPKRRLLSITQPLLILPALTLWLLSAEGVVQAWMVFALVLARGSVLAIDNPARQAFVSEMVGPARVVNAVALNSVVVSAARVVGPAAAGAIIAVAGVSVCFLVNASTFVVMIVVLRLMDPRALEPVPARAREPGAVRLAWRHVMDTPQLRIPLLMMVLVGTVSFNFSTVLPLLASQTWHGSGATYAALTAAMGVGSVVGALVTGARGSVAPALLVGTSAAFGATALASAVAPSLELQSVALALMGAASVAFSAGVNSALQVGAAPAMRGRVMALYSVVFLGSTPIGGPLVGLLCEAFGPRAGLVAGGIAALAAAGLARVAYARVAHPGGTRATAAA